MSEAVAADHREHRMRRWWLRHQLRRAARLRAKGHLSDAQYGVICIDLIEKMRLGRPPHRNEHLEDAVYSWIGFPVRAAFALQNQGPNATLTDLERKLDEYGPWNSATIFVSDALQATSAYRPPPEGGFVWTAEALALLAEANVYYSRIGRFSAWLEQKLAIYQRLFPNVSSATSKIMLALFSAFVGFLIGRAR